MRGVVVRHISFVHMQSEWDFVRRQLGQGTDRTGTGFYAAFPPVYVSRYRRSFSSLRYCFLIETIHGQKKKLSQTFFHPYQALIWKGLWPSGIHPQPECAHTVQATTSPSRFCIWSGHCFGTKRRNQPLGQYESVTLGLFERTAEGCLQQLNVTLWDILSCCYLSAISQDILHNFVWSLFFPLSRVLSFLRTSVWASAYLEVWKVLSLDL